MCRTHVHEWQDCKRRRLLFLEIERQVIQAVREPATCRDDQQDEWQEGESRRAAACFLVPDDAADRNIVCPREDDGNREPEDRQHDEHGHGAVGNRQLVEGDVCDLQQ